VAADLIRIVGGAEVGALQGFKLVNFALMGAVHCGRQRGLQLTGRDERFQLGGSLFMVFDHCRRKRLLIGIAALLRELAGLDLEHVADRGLFHEILALRRDAQRGVDAGFFTDGLRHRRRPEKHEGKTWGKILHPVVLSES
jgi:hypothetical protein